MNQFENKRYNICIVGDECVQGYGDELQLGFIGRILKRVAKDINVVTYNLGRFGADSTSVSKHLEADVNERLSADTDGEVQNRLIIMMPSRDIDQMPTSRSRLNLANILDKNNFPHYRAMVIGPTPRSLDENGRIAELSNACKDVCARRNIPYVDLFSSLVENKQWIHSMLASGAKYPDQVGYGLIAWVVLHSDFERFIK
ncbi:MAG: GDSL-type esterase/lipase family protein [Candidatus Ancillula sp.]|jgi:lysophospholipase L1-like esterase|nr:GDSL-type esterase/lipase family protein [Candidatus Ancillula sp.]